LIAEDCKVSNVVESAWAYCNMNLSFMH